MRRKPRVKTERPVAGFDTECFRNYFFIGLRTVDGRTVGYELSNRMLGRRRSASPMGRLVGRVANRSEAPSNIHPFDSNKVRKILMKYTVCGFNSRDYDSMMVAAALSGMNNSDLKDLSDDIIKNRLKPWEVERKYDLKLPDYFDMEDLFDTNPSVGTGTDDDDETENLFASGSASLKTLAGRMHSKRIQDLPYDEATILTYDQMDELNDYCLNSDCVATLELREMLKEPLELRESMGEIYDFDARSLSDAQMGERMIKTGVERLIGDQLQKASFGGAYTFRYDVPDFICFETTLMREVLEVIKNTDIQVTDKGSVPFPEPFKKFHIEIGGSVYKMGIGGLHSTEKTRVVKSDKDWQLVDFDVGSQYPSIIIKLGLYPVAVGPHFQVVYSGIKDERMAAKRAGQKQRSEGLKVGLNGPYGKLGSRYSILFAPHLMIATTLTGQLTLLMFIERCELAGIRVVSANTDGVVLQVPRSMYEGMVGDRPGGGVLKDLVEWWEQATTFVFEGAEYASVYSRDVNYYLAVKPNGKVKRKGSIANHWHPDSPDYSVREQLKKNPNMTVCGDAIVAYILHGTPVEDFIHGYNDVRGFVRVIKAKGGGDWNGQYLGKTVRYYWGIDGAPIMKGKPNPTTGNRLKVSESDGCVPLMTLPDDYAVPEDLDYQHYIQKTYEIMEDIGLKPRRPVPGRKNPMRRLITRALQINK